MDRWYPAKIVAKDADAARAMLGDSQAQLPKLAALETLFEGADKSRLKFAEFGIWQGGTSVQFARFLGNTGGELHLFDFADNVERVKTLLETGGQPNVFGWGCSYKHLDSYNWQLRLLLERQPELKFDYIYLDGAHTWAIDALTFFLCDMMLKVGGCVEFDDYGWRLRNSSLDPARVPVIAEQYTDEQIDDYQVKAIVDLIVRRKPNYQEVKPNRVFRKTA